MNFGKLDCVGGLVRGLAIGPAIGDIPDADAVEVGRNAGKHKVNKHKGDIRLFHRDWVSGMGLLQYLIAPMALLLSINLYCGAATHTVRLASIACILLNAASLFLIFYRGFFTSLGL